MTEFTRDVYIKKCMDPCEYCTFAKKTNAEMHETYTCYRGWQEIICPQLKSQIRVEEEEGCRQYRIYEIYKRELKVYKRDFPLGIDLPKAPVFEQIDFGNYCSKLFYIWYNKLISERNRIKRIEIYGSDWENDY
jgi:hypothetical protein